MLEKSNQVKSNQNQIKSLKFVLNKKSLLPQAKKIVVVETNSISEKEEAKMLIGYIYEQV